MCRSSHHLCKCKQVHTPTLHPLHLMLTLQLFGQQPPIKGWGVSQEYMIDQHRDRFVNNLTSKMCLGMISVEPPLNCQYLWTSVEYDIMLATFWWKLHISLISLDLVYTLGSCTHSGLLHIECRDREPDLQISQEWKTREIAPEIKKLSTQGLSNNKSFVLREAWMIWKVRPTVHLSKNWFLLWTYWGSVVGILVNIP